MPLKSPVCLEHQHGSLLRSRFCYANKELMNYFTDLMLETGLIIYGRKTCELIITYFPGLARDKTGEPGDITLAEAMTAIPKIFLSRTPHQAGENCRIQRDNPENLLWELKQQPDKIIALSSTSLLPHLLDAGFIDELRLVVHPIIVGGHKHLFDHVTVKTDFNWPQPNRHGQLYEVAWF